MSSSSLLSPPPSPHSAPLPLSSSSSVTRCPELDLSVTLSSTRISHSQQKPRPRGQAGRRKGNVQVCFEEPAVVMVSPEQSRDTPAQQSVRGQRSKGCRHGGASRQWAEPPSAVSNQEPVHLERAGLNTTLALKAELQSLQGAEFNSQKAVQETLQRSERTKNLINTRATKVVNVSRSQLLFTSLVGVDVQEDQLISQVLQQRLLPPCQASRAAGGPSPLLFMTCDHLRQKPVPPEEEPVGYKSSPLPRPAHSTFDLYRRGRY